MPKSVQLREGDRSRDHCNRRGRRAVPREVRPGWLQTEFSIWSGLGRQILHGKAGGGLCRQRSQGLDSREGYDEVFLRKGGRPMRLTYDPKYNIAYLKFQERSAEVHTLKVSEELNIDLAPDGTIYGIELLNANEQMYRQDEGKFLLINEVTREKAEIPLAPVSK